jgi:hypothetical protein
VVEKNEVLFAVQDFSRAVSPRSFEEQEKQIGVLLAARGIRLLNNQPNEVQVARRQCALESGTPPVKRRAVMVVRFITADLSSLPDSVERAIRGGRYRSAVVGACAQDKPGPFTSYRVAIVFY